MKDFRLYPEGDALGAALGDSPDELDELDEPDEPTATYPTPDPFADPTSPDGIVAAIPARDPACHPDDDEPTGVFVAGSTYDDDPPTEVLPIPESGVPAISTRRRPVIDEPTDPGRPSVMSPESQRRRALMQAGIASEIETPRRTPEAESAPALDRAPHAPPFSAPPPPFIDPDATEVNPVAVQPRARRPVASAQRANTNRRQRPPPKPIRPELLSRATVMDLTPPETGLPFEESRPDTLRSSSVESRPKVRSKTKAKTKNASDLSGSSAKRFIRRAWQEATPIQRILLFLIPTAAAALIVSGPEALGFTANETTEASQARPETAPRAAAPIPAPAPATKQRVPQVAPREPAETAPAPPTNAAPTRKVPPTPGPAGAATRERAAVDALVSGNRALARDRYAELARTEPSNPAFAAAARALASP